MMSVSACKTLLIYRCSCPRSLSKCNSMLFETKNISLDVTEEDLTDLANGVLIILALALHVVCCERCRNLLLTTMKQKTWCEILM